MYVLVCFGHKSMWLWLASDLSISATGSERGQKRCQNEARTRPENSFGNPSALAAQQHFARCPWWLQAASVDCTHGPSFLPSFLPSLRSPLASFPPSLLPSFLPSFPPSSFPPFLLPSFPPSLLPSLLSSFPPFLLPSFLPSFLSSFPPFPFLLPSFPPFLLPSFPPSLLPSFPPSFLPSLLPSFLPSLLSSFPPFLLPSFLHGHLFFFFDAFIFFLMHLYFFWCIFIFFWCFSRQWLRYTSANGLEPCLYLLGTATCLALFCLGCYHRYLYSGCFWIFPHTSSYFTILQQPGLRSFQPSPALMPRIHVMWCPWYPSAPSQPSC